MRNDTLTTAEKEHLDREGYLPLPEIIPPEVLAALRERVAEQLAEEDREAGGEINFRGTEGVKMLGDLVNKGPVFEFCYTHPRVLAAMAHALQDEFKLSSLILRVAHPGDGLQGLHADRGTPVEPGEYQVCNSIWLLDDFTEQNGSTRVVRDQIARLYPRSDRG